MLHRLAAAALALPLLAAPAWAAGFNGPYGFTVGGSGSLSLYVAPVTAAPGCAPGGAGGMGGMGGAGPQQLGPWYLYWPLEAHFSAPAPTGYPYWPGPQGLPTGQYTANPGDYANHQYGGHGHVPYYWQGR